MKKNKQVPPKVVQDEPAPSQTRTYTGPPLPKHIPFPESNPQSEFLIETLTCLVSIFSMCAQFLLMYRTVWWLPEIHNKQAMNFHLIDKHCLAFIVIILGRKFYYSVIETIICVFNTGKIWKRTLKYGGFGLLVVGLTICTINLLESYSVMYIFCLLYPLIIYPVFFGLNLQPFFATTFETDVKYFNGMPCHSCSTNAYYVRVEANVLKLDFNNRFKQVIYSSIVSGYFAGFIPLCFAHKYLYYDKVTVVLNILYIWLSALTMCAVQCFPSKYCDILHRSALHLGVWTKIDIKGAGSNVKEWDVYGTYASGTVIKHFGDYYKCDGPTTTSVPGEMQWKRFYFIFKNPTTLFFVLSVGQLVLISAQFLHLVLIDEWNTLIAIGYLIFTNFYTLFCLLRSLRVTYSIYSTEAAIISNQRDYSPNPLHVD